MMNFAGFSGRCERDQETFRINALVGMPYADAGCWRVVRAALDGMGFPEWEPTDALRAWQPGEDIAVNVPTWWKRVYGQPHRGDVMIFLKERVPTHCGIVGEDAMLLHGTKTTGARLLRLSRVPWQIHSVWRPQR